MNKYMKNILSYQDFYMVTYTKNIHQPYLIFLHGGPGLNCAILEYLIEKYNYFSGLNYNLILYDQRGCGKSLNFSLKVSHDDNILDLYNIFQYLSNKFSIMGFIGHSYGAKILYDYYTQYNILLPGIFIATAKSMLIPRLNNLMLDLSYLKKNNQAEYKILWSSLKNIDLEKIVKISEDLMPTFKENKDRLYLYWANLECCELVQYIQKIVNMPMNINTFLSVHKSLFINESTLSVEISNLTSPYLWINGFHDFIMNGPLNALTQNSKATVFYKSAHYPHLEENDKFCILLNDFLDN